ncbi:hypothetical protein EJB05_14616, partial [Eragrostis curvula]
TSSSSSESDSSSWSKATSTSISVHTIVSQANILEELFLKLEDSIRTSGCFPRR